MSFTIDELLSSKAEQSRIISELRARVAELERENAEWRESASGLRSRLNAVCSESADSQARVVELERRHAALSEHTIETRCPSCEVINRNKLGDMIAMAEVVMNAQSTDYARLRDMAENDETMGGEGHIPGQGDFPGPLSAAEVNLLQHENLQLREHVAELRKRI